MAWLLQTTGWLDGGYSLYCSVWWGEWRSSCFRPNFENFPIQFQTWCQNFYGSHGFVQLLHVRPKTVVSVVAQTRTQSLLGGGREETQRIWERRLRGAQRVMGRTLPLTLCVPLKATGYDYSAGHLVYDHTNCSFTVRSMLSLGQYTTIWSRSEMSL